MINCVAQFQLAHFSNPCGSDRRLKDKDALLDNRVNLHLDC
jgi:hypothetical protein